MISTSAAIYLSITLCVGTQCRVVSFPELTFASPTVCAGTAEILAALEARNGETLTQVDCTPEPAADSIDD